MINEIIINENCPSDLTEIIETVVFDLAHRGIFKSDDIEVTICGDDVVIVESENLYIEITTDEEEGSFVHVDVSDKYVFEAVKEVFCKLSKDCTAAII